MQATFWDPNKEEKNTQLFLLHHEGLGRIRNYEKVLIFSRTFVNFQK